MNLQAQAGAHRLATQFLDEDVQSSFEQENAFLAKRRADGTMSTAHDILAENEWQPRIPNTKVLKFKNVQLGKHEKVSAKTKRPPWTPKHMKCLFSAPIWNGSGGKMHRRDASAAPMLIRMQPTGCLYFFTTLMLR